MTCLDDISLAAQETVQWLAGKSPQLGIILGSGLSGIVAELEQAKSLPFDQLSGFPSVGVSGHGGQVHAGELFGVPVLVFQGRYHCYEGYDAWQVTAPIRLAAAIGCRQLLLTNAAGGISSVMRPGDFMLVTDHLNFTGLNPLIGRPERNFVDLSRLYSQNFYAKLSNQLKQEAIQLHSGALAWMIGPSYETPAEINALEFLGAAAVSMSTIPEAIIARLFGLDVVAVSLIANLAAGKSLQQLNHDEVLGVGSQSDAAFKVIVKNLLSLWCVPPAS